MPFKKTALFCLLSAFVVVKTALGASPGIAVAVEKIGTKIDAKFQDARGALHLHDLKDQKATVVVFLSFECPVSTSYTQVLGDMARTLEPQGVAFLGVIANEEEGDVAAKVQDFKISFPVYQDPHHTIANAFKAHATPEAFVLDANKVLRYRGRIDNAYAARLKKNQQITRNDLRQAVDEILAGKPVSVPATPAIGCPIQRELPSAKATGAVTYHRDVLPILQKNCQSCHRPGEVGPFSLMTYRHAVNWAADIKEYTLARKMPPWKPVAGPDFHNDRTMSDKDIAILATWVDAGSPEGDPHDAPPPRAFVQGWQYGKPDLVLKVSGEFQVAASGNDIFRCFVLPTDLPEDKYVTALEVRPGNSRVVHHALLFLDTERQARKLEDKAQKKQGEKDFGPGYSVAMGVGFVPRGAMGGWAPGQMPRHLPEGTAYFLPKGADVVMQLHYHRDGRVEKDTSELGLYFSKKPVARRFQGLVIPGRFVLIPSGEDRYRVSGSMWVRQDCDLHSVMPHMHMLGREVKVTMTPPDGDPQTLVAIKDWDYNWQETYFFKKTIPVKAGTRFDIEAFYDNSAHNPNNPNIPPRPVFFGEQTTNEMLFGFLGATSSKPGRIAIDVRGKNEKKNESAKKVS